MIWEPNAELKLEKEGETVWQGTTDENGKASFSIKFDDTNFYDSWILKDNAGASVKVSFFSKPPVELKKGMQINYILIVGVLAIVAIIMLFFWKKFVRTKVKN